MSWMKKRGSGTPSPAPTPPVPMYNPNQHSTTETQWKNQPVHNNWYTNQQVQYQPVPKQGQHPQHNYWQQQYNNPPVYNQNSQYGEPQYHNQHVGYLQTNTGYGQQNYNNVQYGQLSNQNNLYETQTGQQHAEADAWNWGWGDEDNSNVQANLNQTGRVDGAFSNEEAWNWGVEDAKNPVKNENPGDVQDLFPKISKNSQKTDNDTAQDHSTTGKRGKLETPQWSTESQISQESSDDVLHTSESDKSHMMSRSSTISHSPISGQDPQPQEDAQVKRETYENEEIVNNSALPRPPVLPPPQSVNDESKNPYKRTTAVLSHSSTTNMFRGAVVTPPDSRQNLYQTNFHSQQVNLETPPENSEQPDPVNQPQPSQKVKPNHRPDNNEAPINDRNQYLETGHLSEGNYNDHTDDIENEREDLRGQQEGSDNVPPPGLRRMVPGQLEQREGASNPGNFTDEPPPGLSRMVLGQTEANIPTATQTYGPPEGLRRMVPGESSSPESPLNQQKNQEENDSEPEFNQLVQHASQPRSATIGADTPPSVNNPPTSTNPNRTNPDNKRRDSVEGELPENEIAKMTNSVRNMTVGENVTDGHTSNTSLPDTAAQRRHSKQESSDSDSRKPSIWPSRDKRITERSRREREKEREKLRKERERYSPDSYRDKKYERRKYRGRGYEEDTDYYSDKEKDRKNYEDRDRRYGSLRKDKEKDRRRRDPRDYYYSNRYDEEYEQRSRPSSRSDSMHDSYRARDRDDRDRRHRDREKYRSRRDPRDVYNPYQGFSYDPYNPYYQQYQYYENLRRTNPQAYAEWYRKYYQQATGQTAPFGGEDRASVHSGRSSANDELAKDRYTRQSFYGQMSASQLGGYYRDMHTHSISGGQYALDTSSYSRPFDQTDSSINLEDTTLASQRLTPAKFATAHIKASIRSGKLLRILPHYPMDGQSATVEICNTQSFLVNDEEFKEMSQFPGPLVKGVTHKKTIIEYCENKIRNAITGQKIQDVDSYILMWELLILLIRQNGMVVGADIAELLLKNKGEIPVPRPSSATSNLSSNNGELNPSSESGNQHKSDLTGSLISVMKEEEITNKFRDFLLYGSGQEALEWAMKHSLWGHALFLASKLDKRTYANVMMRFANGLTMNDPLQTLYQLLSGKMPAAVTCISDEKWGDWRPHLAMILSNSSQRPELNCKAITSMGDTLRHRGNLYAAQFCYLMAEVGFGKYDDPETRLVLLGADHSKPHPNFPSNESIHMTEIYEYACGLNDPDFFIPHFQVYKFLLATRLVDRGLVEKSLAYLEKISSFIVSNPSLVDATFVDNVYNLADRLKFYDLVGEVEDESEFGGILETNRPDNSWLRDLKAVQNDFHYLTFQAGLIHHQSMPVLPVYTSANDQDNYEQGVVEYQQQQYEYDVPQQSWQQNQQPGQEYQEQQQQQPQQTDFSQNQYQDPNSYWTNQQQQWGDQLNQYSQENSDQQTLYNSNPQEEEKPQPSITLPNQADINKDKPEKPEEPKQQPQPTVQEKTQSTGWFGGIFSKLALKPKNQMKLPEDKNPKIVWDQDKKRWVNIDDDTNDAANEFKPPPKLSELMPKIAQQSISTPAAFDLDKTLTGSNQGVTSTNSIEAQSKANIFKLQRSRNLKKSYVDIFNPNGNSGPTSLPLPTQSISRVPQMNFFVPQQVTDPNAPIDFLTPGGVPHVGETQQQ
ncbi:uncharacterized protein LOC130901379 isoform X3 [Diorhabda carinulata]|uniref:uncharacterized protein LOC130901379 isoform X3 n=1 Tax=Diorhabda carinulata TaxID=1163345 RepID=UPI0025A0C2E3|nr:uncharacterized protein LOC130901379 isoform X3 [Diorhabda carinulata]